MSKKLTRELISLKAKSDKIQSIKNLNLWGSDLEDVSILAQMPSLEIVSLSVNKIRTLKPFSNLKNLKELYLRQNMISDLREIQYLENCPNLKILWLSQNPISDNKNYRKYVLSCLPDLVKLDDVMVTDAEREGVENNEEPEVVKANDNNEDNYEDEDEEEGKYNNNKITGGNNRNSSNKKRDIRDEEDEEKYVNINKSTSKKQSRESPAYNDDEVEKVPPKKNRYQEVYSKNDDDEEYEEDNNNNYYRGRGNNLPIRKAPTYNDNYRGAKEKRNYYQREEGYGDEAEDDVRPNRRGFGNTESYENRLRRIKTAQVGGGYNYGERFDNINEEYEYDNRRRGDYGNKNKTQNLSRVAQSIVLLVKELNRNELMTVKREIEKLIDDY